jgi:hypothetical protein
MSFSALVVNDAFIFYEASFAGQDCAETTAKSHPHVGLPRMVGARQSALAGVFRITKRPFQTFFVNDELRMT